MNQLRHLRFFGGKFENLVEHMKKHKALIAPKFQIVENTLEKELADLGIANWSNPQGGYFISFQLFGHGAGEINLIIKAFFEPLFLGADIFPVYLEIPFAG